MNIERDVPLAPYTTFKTGGNAEYFASVTNVEEVEAALQFAKQTAAPLHVLGGGSNLLVADEGIAGLVIKNAIETYVVTEEGDGVLVTAGAGMNFDNLVARTVSEGWWGLENLSHIPGTVGATPVQNVGAYGVEVADVIEWVTAVDILTHKEIRCNNSECQFGYRDSRFKQQPERYFITSVTFRLLKTPTPQLTYKDLEAKKFDTKTVTSEEVRQAVIAIRSKKFPDWSVVGTAGSFFKNPVITQDSFSALLKKYPDVPHFETEFSMQKIPLGWILDKVCNLRGCREGNVGLYEAQALVMVKYGDATTADILAFANMVTQKVYEATGITIEREVTLWE